MARAKVDKEGKKWQTRIEKAEKFMEKAVAHGNRVYDRYQDERADRNIPSLKRANIFYSNVNTLKESLFNSMPTPSVSQLQKGTFNDPVSRVAATMVQRGLNYEVECAVDFREAVRSAILDRLVPGIGQVWIRFDGDEEDVDGETVVTPGTERLYIEPVYWEDFLYEPVRQWSQVSWVGRRLSLTKAEVTALWGSEAVDKIEAVKLTGPGSATTPKQINEDKYCVYEIWDKIKREVLHIAKGVLAPLDRKPDPYNLVGFFPCPRPLIANPTTKALLPVTDFHISQDQYNQLDVLYARISLIIDAVKVAGVYDAKSKAISRMLEGQENSLIPVDNWAMYLESGGAKGMIDWYPVETVVRVLAELQKQFEAVKGVLQEVSGMADIVRGDTNQYETAEAQKIKAQFASVRMNGYQRDVAEFVTDILNIMAEMMVELYSPEKFVAIIGKLMPADEALIPDAGALLQNDFLRTCRVSIEADSLTQADWALEKSQRTELITYVSQYLQAALPAVQQSPSLAPLLVTMLKFGTSGFKGASEFQGQLDQMLDQLAKEAQQPKAPPPPTPEEKKMQMEVFLAKQEAGLDAAAKQQEMKLKSDEAQMDLMIKRIFARMDQQEREQKLWFEQQLAAIKLQTAREQSEGSE